MHGFEQNEIVGILAAASAATFFPLLTAGD